MIAQIIPAKRMPLSLPFLDYSVPDELKTKIKIGQLVKIPFRNLEEFGVVSQIKTGSSEKKLKIKPIKEIILSAPILTPSQIDFLKEISELYHVSLGFLLKNNLLPLQKRKLQKISVPTKKNTSKNSQPTKPTVFIYKNIEEKKDIILKNIGKKSQTLILVPELAAVAKLQNLLPENIQKQTTVITSELSDKELFAKWLEIWTGEKRIIIGTRTALFLPWSNLKNIILDDEGDPNHKSWDMSPRLHSRDGAVFLAKHHGAKLFLLAHTPAVETYYFAKKSVYAGEKILIYPIKSPPGGVVAKGDQFNRVNPEIIDMRAERRAKNYSLISVDLLKKFQAVKDGDIFFFLNRRGTASYVGCRDCGNVLQCPSCHLSLTYHQNSGLLDCHYCGHIQPMPTTCQKCRGVNVAMYGAGTQLAEELIKKILPPNDKRAIIRIDSDANDLEKLNGEETPGTISPLSGNKYGAGKIIIGTQLAWAKINWQKIKLLAFLDADAPLFIPEYKIIENLWQQLRDAQFNLPDTAQLVIQTGHPEHLVFQSLFNPENFYAQQLAERQALGYPPFRFLLKLFHGQTNAALAKKEAERLARQLQTLTKGDKNITISDPLETSPARHAGQYWQVILAKIKYATYKQSVRLLLSRAPDNWKADPNPNSILSFS